MKRIVVYKSSTGFTAKYANWIAEELGCEAIELNKIKKCDLVKYDEIIYGGWLMANMVCGYNKINEMKFAFFKTALWNGMVVLTPKMTYSLNALCILVIASSLFLP